MEHETGIWVRIKIPPKLYRTWGTVFVESRIWFNIEKCYLANANEDKVNFCSIIDKDLKEPAIIIQWWEMMVNTWEYKPHANDGLQYIIMYIALRLCFQSIQTCKCWNMAEPNKLITLERRMVRSCQWMFWRSTDLWLALVFVCLRSP